MLSILFFDIETIPHYYRYSELPEKERALWDEKHKNHQQKSPEELYEKAGIYGEFSKVFCVGMAYEVKENFFNLYLIQGEEKEILQKLSQFLKKTFPNNTPLLCAHNGKEFDIPFLCRRFRVNRLPIPSALNFQGKKPWEVDIPDTMQMWKFGDIKNYTSLDLLAHIFDIPSPKKIMKGSEVSRMVYVEKNYEAVYSYCLEDVKSLVKVYYHLAGNHEKAERIQFSPERNVI